MRKRRIIQEVAVILGPVILVMGWVGMAIAVLLGSTQGQIAALTAIVAGLQFCFAGTD